MFPQRRSCQPFTDITGRALSIEREDAKEKPTPEGKPTPKPPDAMPQCRSDESSIRGQRKPLRGKTLVGFT
jgi:hypothetical protein